jgi:hypothetical protein
LWQKEKALKATIPPIQSNTWKRIKTRHLLLAAGAALISGVLISGAEIRTTRPAAPESVQTSPRAQILSKSQPADVVVYIVGSEADKEALERDGTFREWFSEPGTGGLSTVAMRVIVIEPGQEESLGLLSELVPEAQLTTGRGAMLSLHDMR